MKCRIWIGLTVLFAASSAVLLYGSLNQAISYSNCFDELERATKHERLLKQLLPPLAYHITRTQLDTATQRAGFEADAFDKDEHERVVAGISFVFDDAGRVREIQFE